MPNETGMEVDGSSNNGNDDDTQQQQSKKPKITLKLSKKRGVPPAGMSEEDIVKGAQEGKYSLFKTILSVIEKEETLDAVPTPLMLSKVAMVVPPASIPGSMDAKDMVLAALQFLSSTFEAKSKEVMELPVIRAVQRYSDLEKLHYLKEGMWTLEDFEKDNKLLKLEDLFLKSPFAWKWMRREAFCPRLSKAEEAEFFLNGTVRKGAMATKEKSVARQETCCCQEGSTFAYSILHSTF